MMYLNGDRCPCCGQKIEGKNREWLRLFGRLCEALGLEPERDLADELDGAELPPPDAGINPPVNPKL